MAAEFPWPPAGFGDEGSIDGATNLLTSVQVQAQHSHFLKLWQLQD